MKTKYYVEFVDKDENCNFVMQSQWFLYKEDAENWLFREFDFIDFDKLSIFIMSANFDKYNHFGDIELCKQIDESDYIKKRKY